MARASPTRILSALPVPIGVTMVFCLPLCPSLFAHDFWIEPSTFRPAPHTVVALHLRVGEDFHGEVVRRRSAHIRSFLVTGPRGVQEALGVEGTDPAGYASITDPGLYTTGYRSTRTFVEIEAEEFEHYLAEEGLERISRLRAQRGERRQTGKETYSRCARSLIWVDGADGEGRDAGFDCPLELRAEKNPYLLRSGAELPIRLLFRGEPVAEVLVTAIPKDAPGLRISARTDAEGRVRFRLSRPGIWLVKAVHMVPGPRDEGADWESFWASLTFAPGY